MKKVLTTKLTGIAVIISVMTVMNVACGVDILSRIDFQAPDFDREVLTGDNLGGIFGSLDHESFQDLGQEHIFQSIEGLQANDFGLD